MNARHADVLLVEDQPTDAELVMRAMRGVVAAERVRWVRDGEQALEVLRDSASIAPDRLPRLVLLDLKLPRFGGLEVLARIKDDEVLKPVPVVVLSSSADQTDIARAFRGGANSYVVKPVDIDELDRTVLELVRYWMHINRMA